MNGTRQGNHTEGVRTMTRFNTQLVHGLPVNDNNTGAVNPPIYNSSTYAFESVGTMPRWDYARSGNPTREFLEKQIAQLEHGTRGFAFGSGLAAIHAVLSIFQPGDRIIVGKNIYGGTYSLFHEYFERWGVIVEEWTPPIARRSMRWCLANPPRAMRMDVRPRPCTSKCSPTRFCKSTT